MVFGCFFYIFSDVNKLIIIWIGVCVLDGKVLFCKNVRNSGYYFVVVGCGLNVFC